MIFRIFIILILIPFAVNAQKKAEKEVIKMSAITSKTNKTIELNWEARAKGTFTLFKRSSLGDSWGTPIKTFTFNQTSYVDSNIAIGEDQEYHLVHQATGDFGHGYLYSGIEKKAQHNMGGIILLIDSTFIDVLKPEIERLENDLFNEGWWVNKLYVNPALKPKKVKEEITVKAKEMKGKLDAIFIIGHVPVPYSGDFKAAGYPPPDGHIEGRGNHTGAWSADVYYADRLGTWTDITVRNTSGAQSRNHNKPYDGKFDQTVIPRNPEYQVGRVDMSNLPAFNKSDTLLLKQYLDRNHLWRTGKISTVKRGLIDNNFNSLNLASTGWANLTAMVNADSVTIRDYKTNQMTSAYLWSFGCGAGSYSSCKNVIKTSEFASDSLLNIYTILSGSYFGDFDSKNNLLRSALANSSLISFWGGIPKWYIHTMGLGKNIGYGAKVTQGNTSEYFNGSFNASQNKIHIALMGDPTLTLNYFKGPSNLVAVSNKNSVKLTWQAAPNSPEGYFIYRFDSSSNSFIQLNSSPETSLNFTDKTNSKSGELKYLVRAMQIESTPSGTYQNLGNGTNTSLNFVYSDPTSISESVLENTIKLFPNPGNGTFNLEFSTIQENELLLSVYDVQGKIQFKKVVGTASGLNQIEVNSELKTGMYWLVIKSRMEQITKKLIITSF